MTGEARWEFALPQPELAAAHRLATRCSIGLAVAQVLLRRGIVEAQQVQAFLQPRLAELSCPSGMCDREAAAERLADACRRGEKIAVFGDYDVDGMTSCALLSEALAALGAATQPLVADRFDGGYGLSQPAFERCLATGAKLWITCDCGSSDHQRLAAAQHRGIEVIVVDHHLVPAEPLPALAFLNPHRPECAFPFKGMCSAGLAFSLVAAVRKKLGSDLDPRRFLDLVALGTIADVAPLHGDNRALVRAGLQRVAASDARPGLVALRESARLQPGAHVSAFDIAFRLAPRLNAAGRLGETAAALRLLLATQPSEARDAAAALEAINQRRKEIERAVTVAAHAQVEQIYSCQPTTGIVVAAVGWHRGVVGIVAARLVDRYGVPAIVIGFDQGELGHGSGRTPRGLPLHDAVRCCRDELERFGGHQAAIGVTLRQTRLEAFRAAFADATRPLLVEHLRSKGPTIADVVLDGHAAPLPSVAELRSLEPCGEANAAPLFALSDTVVQESRVVAGQHLKLQLRIGDRHLAAIGWDMAQHAPTLPSRATWFGHLRPDTWRGGDALELQLAGWTS